MIVEWGKTKDLQATMASLCGNTELKELILKDIVQQGKDEGLKGFEQVIISLDILVCLYYPNYSD